MGEVRKRHRKKTVIYLAVFLAVNILAIAIVSGREAKAVDEDLTLHANETKEQFEGIMDGYRHSFSLFTQMLTQEIKNNPNPDDIWNYLKKMDSELLEIEGKTFDGLYMYYQGRYLYSWDTPYSQYESTGYDATQRPWYKDAAAGEGAVVFTPPYMSYANNYVLTTISQLQPDGETVFAYDIKMADIQTLVSRQDFYKNQQVIIYDDNGTVIGSTDERYLGGSLYQSQEEAARNVDKIKEELEAAEGGAEDASKIEETLKSAEGFLTFREELGDSVERLEEENGRTLSVNIGGRRQYGCVLHGGGFHFMILAPRLSILRDTTGTWLVPMLLVELLLIYVLASLSRAQRNKELRDAYVELGQTQRRLEIALSVAQQAAAIDDLTGMMNAKSFRKELTNVLTFMEEDENGILVMLDGDHFKRINDDYGHNVGDEVIKLSAQMIVGRIRTVDLASRLHGDEFAIFIANTCDCEVAKRIIGDINLSIAKEAKKRNMPAITLSAGAVVVKKGDSYTTLSKAADEALYKAKETHNGNFACN